MQSQTVAPAITPASTTTPATASALLRTLKVDDCSVKRQRKAIAEWLIGHAADPQLRRSLRANGFGLLVKPRQPLPPVAHHSYRT